MAINIGPQGVIDDTAKWIGDPTLSIRCLGD